MNSKYKLVNNNPDSTKKVRLSLVFNDKHVYRPVKAEAHTPPYKIHKYFARRPWNVFNQLVNVFSKENEIVLDPFCGGGVTIYEGLKQNRKVIGCDINPLSIFIVRNMVRSLPDTKKLLDIFGLCEDHLRSLYGRFNTFQINGETIQTDWVEVSFIVKCAYCGNDLILSNQNKVKNGFYRCSNSDCSNNIVESRLCERKGLKPLFSIGHRAGKKIIKPFDEIDKKLLEDHLMALREEIKKRKIAIPKDKIPLAWDRQLEDQLAKKGIIYFQDFFTERNLLINLLLLDFIKSFKTSLSPEEYELLRITFSNTIKDTNIMSFTNDTWQSGKPTTWSKHAYWVPSQFCEVNILDSFKRAEQKIISAVNYNGSLNLVSKEASQVTDLIKLNSSCDYFLSDISVSDLDLPQESVDAIITDPPYGSNVQYLELSHFWHPWNKDLYKTVPNFKDEAISNRKKNFDGAKSMYDYEKNLLKVFNKAYIALRPEKYMVLTFNNKSISAWLALLFSIFKAGFSLDEGGIYFQDGVENYKQTAHTKYNGSPYGDFIYVFKKDINYSPLFVYDNESSFWEELDGIFKQNLAKNDDTDRNEIIRRMFLEAMPKIQSFSRTYLLDNDHNLYSLMKKDYFGDLYA